MCYLTLSENLELHQRVRPKEGWMQFLLRALNLAEKRGYLRYPEVIAQEPEVPIWFRRLGTQVGLAEFEARRGIQVPAAVREFYDCIPLACFLEACLDSKVFLRDIHDPDPPPLVDWPPGLHLVFAFHNHSGAVCAAVLDREDPSVVWGFEDEAPWDQAPVVFSDWVLGAVEGYEQQLGYWQGVYERCRTDPGEARRLGGIEWIRHMPGMAGRLGGRT